MSKILPISSPTKIFKRCLSQSAPKAESVVIEKTEQAANETAQVTSKQIEAYYKRYGKIEAKTPKEKKVLPPKEEKISEVDKMVQKECDAYNKIRYVDVSEDALKDLEHNFEEKRQKVINIILANSQNLPPEYVKAVKKIEKPEQIAMAIRSYALVANQTLNQKFNDIIQQVIKKQRMSLKDQQMLFRAETKICDVYLELIKAVTEPSKDPRVIRIENYIKATYNMDFVHLDTFEEAKKVLKTIKLARQNGITLPKNIIISPFTMFQTGGVNLTHNMTEHSVILAKQKEMQEAAKKAYQQLTLPQSKQIAKSLIEQDARWHATDDELHIYMHEFAHSKYFLELLLPMKAKPVPMRYNKAAQKVGIYALSSRSELATELKTKSILRSLSADEKELLAYFE